MATTSLSEEMINNFVQLNTDEQKSVLQMVKTFLKSKKNEFSPQTPEAYNAEINEAVEAYKRGEFTTMAQLEEEMKHWK
jgi:non-homologous end joining protein Ku